MVAEEESQKQQQYGMVQELLRQSNNLREELQNLQCLRKIKAEERGQKHRELLRAQVHVTHMHDGLVLMDHWYIFQLQPLSSCILMCKWDTTSFMFRLLSKFLLELLYSADSQSHGKTMLGSWIKTPSDLSVCVCTWTQACRSDDTLVLPPSSAAEPAHPTGAFGKRPNHHGPQQAEHHATKQVSLLFLFYPCHLSSINIGSSIVLQPNL